MELEEKLIKTGKRRTIKPRNTDFARHFEYKGKMYKASELAEIAGCSYQLMVYRLRTHTVEDAVESALRGYALKRSGSKELFEYNGKMYTVDELAKLAGCTGKEMDIRLDFYHTVEDAIRGVAAVSK